MDTPLESHVQDAIASVCNIKRSRVSLDASLRDLGVDSLAAAEVIVELEIALGRQLPVDVLRRLDDAETVRDVVRHLEAVTDSGPLHG